MLHSLPPATKLGQGYVFTGVCHSVNRGEYLTPPRPEADTLQTRYAPLGPGTPPGTRYTPPAPGTPWIKVHRPWDQVHPLGPGTPWTRYTPIPRTRYTPTTGTRYTPQDQVHPPMQSMLGDTVNERAVRILLECNLVMFTFWCKNTCHRDLVVPCRKC